MNPRVLKVKTRKDFKLELCFTTGEEKIFDVRPYLETGIFKELKDPGYFGLAKVFNGTIMWPHQQDFCPDTLYLESEKNTETVRVRGSRPIERFRGRNRQSKEFKFPGKSR